MEEILKKIKYTPELQKLITRLAATEISAISQPCYFPPLKKSYNEMLMEIGLTDQEVKAFIRRMLAGSASVDFRIMNDSATILLLLIMHIFIKKKNTVGLSDALVYHMVRQYSHVMNRQFPKYCNADVFRYALNNLTKTHLFIREKTIASSLVYLAKEVLRRFAPAIQKWDVEQLVQFVYISRHRISQSVKSFAETYYQADKEGHGIRTQIEPSDDDEGNTFQYQIVERGKKLIDEISKKITVYRYVDKAALDFSLEFTKVKTEIASSIMREMAHPQYAEEIRMLLTLYIRKMEEKNQLCGRNYLEYVKSLMVIKRTTEVVYFKKYAIDLLKHLLKNAKMMHLYNSATNQGQFNLAVFLAVYITSVFKNSLC